MRNENGKLLVSRTLIYVAMAVLLGAICFGAYRDAPPILLAVGFIGEIILVSTVHLSSVIQESGFSAKAEPPDPLSHKGW